MVSIPDYPSAVWAERAGIDIAAVGDSLGMTNYGHPNTLPVTVDMMIQHAQAVRRGAPNCMVLVAMPYGSYATEEIGVLNALRIMKEGGADVVKMQGGKEKAPIIKAIADAGVPVMSHVGMCPHFMHLYGGFKLQGKTADEAMRIIEDGKAIEEAGACGFEIEAVPAPVAKAVDDAVDIFTFAIGAGSASCGQLCWATTCSACSTSSSRNSPSDMPSCRKSPSRPCKAYASEVRDGKFPDADHSYGMKPEEADKLQSMSAKHRKI